MKRLSLLWIFLLLAGCATEAKYRNVLDSWRGADELGLIRSWGPPQQTYESYGHKFLVYRNARDIFIPGMAPSYQTTFIGNTAYTNSYGGTSDTSINVSCTTTFEVVDGKIFDWSFRGNDCTSH